MMKISVLIATRGRRRLLAQCLDSVLAQRRRPDEILVIDNSPAGTAQPHALPEGVRLVREPRRGVVPARNCGLSEAHGEVAAFLDDDCLAPSGWLAALETCFADPAVAAAGGPARPLWLSPPPYALLHSPRARSYLGLLDLGPNRKPIDPAREYLVGGNLAIRKSALEAGKRFVGVFAFPGTGACGEDTEMSRFLASRRLVLYDPAAWVHHCILPEKMRWSRLAVRAFCIEAANVRLRALPEQKLGLAQLLLWEGGLNAAKSLGRFFGRWLSPVAMESRDA